MGVVSILSIILSLSLISAQEAKTEDQSKQQQQAEYFAALKKQVAALKQMRANAPATLPEAHAALEKMLSPQALAEIDAMPSEKDMIQYHFSLGLNIRNGWGLWADSPLAKHMEELGFTHPDDMSNVILVTFWRKRHGQDLRLAELAEEAQNPLKHVREQEERRVQEAKTKVRNMVFTAALSVVLLTGGLACLIASKMSLFRKRIRSSASPGLISKVYASLHKVAYVLMGVGVLLVLLLLWGLRLQA